jgi:hypothetical protein
MRRRCPSPGLGRGRTGSDAGTHLSDALMVATLNQATSIRTTSMHPTASDRSDWTPQRLDRLARGMFPVVFGRPAPEGDHVLADEDNEPAGEEHP